MQAQSGMQAAPIAATAAPAAPSAPVAGSEPAAPPVSPVSPAATDAPATEPASAPPSPPAAASADTPSAAGMTDIVAQPRDPWVKVNRAIFSFDVALERNLLAPVSHGYVHVVPHVVRFHVTSALLNLGEPLTAVNDLLQLRFGRMGKTVYRFIINSTLGVAGLFDIAKGAGIPIHISDFGQTLGRYGLKPGNYVMIPLLGPSDVRDGFGRIVDTFLDPMQYLIGGITTPEGASLFVFEGIDWRSRADDTMKAVYGATDPYAFTRSAYTQSRAATVAEATGKQQALPDFDAAPGTP
jgi:phospholipid-binding lipoprotein MlaA